MGSPSYEAGRNSDEGPVRAVRIKAFRMGKFEVTRGEFRRFVEAKNYLTEAERDVDVPDHAGDWAKGPNPGCFAYKGGTEFGWKAGTSWRDPGYAQEDDHPVVCVSWNDAQAYIKWLNGVTGRRYRLPSEAEQEYAIRAGSGTAYAWGADANGACAYANVADASAKGRFSGWSTVSCDDEAVFTASVGRYRANDFGLHDTVGNVWEWAQDCYRDSYTGAPVDGGAVEARGCERRVLRGAAWDNTPAWLRSAVRVGVPPASLSFQFGFRLAEDL
jgi:formylglycine-generating enzyme required for sulfatase activity